MVSLLNMCSRLPQHTWVSLENDYKLMNEYNMC